MRIRFTPRARGDLDDIFQYLNPRSPTAARNVMSAIYTAVGFITEFPFGSEATDDPNIRINVVHRYRYKIFYKIADEGIEILHIRHSSRRPWIGLR